MKIKLAVLVLFIVSSISTVLAQSSSKLPRLELFAGYSRTHFDEPGSFATSQWLNGFETQAAYNVNRYFAVTFGFSGHYGSETGSGTPCPPGMICVQVITNFKNNSHLYNILVGPPFACRNRPRLTPYVHALLGAALLKLERYRSYTEDFMAPSSKENVTSIAYALGGGLDLKLAHKFTLRLIQADYNPTHLNGNTQHNARLSFGIGYKI
jgi:hypothetical protein